MLCFTLKTTKYRRHEKKVSPFFSPNSLIVNIMLYHALTAVRAKKYFRPSKNVKTWKIIVRISGMLLRLNSAGMFGNLEIIIVYVLSEFVRTHKGNKKNDLANKINEFLR